MSNIKTKLLFIASILLFAIYEQQIVWCLSSLIRRNELLFLMDMVPQNLSPYLIGAPF